MKQVKSNAAPFGIKYRCDEQVIDINQIGRRNDEACAFPIRTPNQPSDPERDEPMAAVMQDCLEGVSHP